MNPIRRSNGNAIRLSPSREYASSLVAAAYRLVVRLVARGLYHHLKARAIRDLRAVPARYRRDIGVPDHAVEEVADALASRRVAAWVRRRLAAKSSSLIA